MHSIPKPRWINRCSALLWPLFVTTIVTALQPTLRAAEGVQMKQREDRIQVELNGKLFTEYRFTGAPHVYFYPVIGPGNLPMTRSHPMADVPGEEKDHKHHRSLWFSHGKVNDIDFWSEDAKAGSIQHASFLDVKSGKFAGWIRSSNQWIAPDGVVICTSEQLFRLYNRPDQERLFDFEVTLFAGTRDVTLGDTKEGSMGIRLNELLRLKPNIHNKDKTPGTIVLANGIQGADTWGKRSEWCDYHGIIDGKRVGVAIFDHPQNPRHPTYWHVRDYGLFAANPFGIHDFENKPPGTGQLIIPAGRSITFKYRFYIHEGDTETAKVAERFKEYASTPTPGY